MAFPGKRAWKLARPIDKDQLTGVPAFDVWVLFTQDCFPDSAKTLGGAEAMADGGADLAFSEDEDGQTRLPCHVVRCELNATPADSRIEVWVRRTVTTIISDTPIWAWWGDATEGQPLATANYGRNDVYNGITGSGTPVTTWGLWHFDEDPTNPPPQYKDSSGNGRDVQQSTGTGWARSDAAPGRGVDFTGGNNIVLASSATFNVGTGDFSSFAFKYLVSGDNQMFLELAGGASCVFRAGRYVVNSTLVVFNEPWSTGGHGCYIQRSGNRITAYLDTIADINDGSWGSYSINDTAAHRLSHTFEGGSNIASFQGVLTCAPGGDWWRALYSTVTAPSTFLDCTADAVSTSVDVGITFDGLQDGSEVRLYERAHPQEWTIDLTTATPALCDGTALHYEVQGASAVTVHEVWIDLDDGSTTPYGATAWAGETGYTEADYVTNGGRLYVCATTGTSAASGGPTGTGTGITDGACEWDYVTDFAWCDIATGNTAAQIATAVEAVIDDDADVTSSVTDAVISVANNRDGGPLAIPTATFPATVTVTQEGCDANGTTALDTVDDSSGDWVAGVTVASPRLVTVVIMHTDYKFVRFAQLIGRTDQSIPAGALQTEDRVYANPS